eukprot:367853-Prymnesium_polylepis.1
MRLKAPGPRTRYSGAGGAEGTHEPSSVPCGSWGRWRKHQTSRVACEMTWSRMAARAHGWSASETWTGRGPGGARWGGMLRSIAAV